MACERLWEKEVHTVPTGVLGAVPGRLKKHLDVLGLGKITPDPLLRTTSLGTEISGILRIWAGSQAITAQHSL